MASLPVQRRMSSSTGTGNRSPVVKLSESLLSSLKHLLKKPLAFPFLLVVFLLLTWVSLKLQRSSSFSQFSASSRKGDGGFYGDDGKTKKEANLVAFKAAPFSPIAKDKRGWLLNPISLALDYGIKGGAVTCASIHLGEIQPGGVRGNHRHHDCNETFVIWGATTLFRLENNEIVGKGYAEVIIPSDDVAVAASPRGTAHALVNIDPTRSTFFIGCQDSVINSNSTSDFNVWKDF